MKSLIIGGAGFVGGYLIGHLKDNLGHEVAVTKLETETIPAEGVEVYDLNIMVKEDIIGLLEEVHPDYIFHLAAQSSVAVCWRNPQLTIDVNIKGAVNVLEALRELDYKPRVLLIGSGEEYGHILPGELPISENNNIRPGSIYAATKVCQNFFGKIYADAYQLDVMMVRAFNHIGPNQAPLFVVADFCKQVAEIEAGKKDAVIQVGNLSARRDFTDVRDVVRAYGLLMEKGKAGETYNVGSGHAIAIEDILHMILKNSNAQVNVKVDSQKLRPVDVPIIEADISKLSKETGWQPGIPLEQTIRETLDYWRNKQE
ncbi:MAG: GDP-mannose 4,6-dehydratase [Lachnospiraceae bacterium]|nr:GDP-mannose 4,6-dehydratase [Lachnospiraceae bacterium]MDE6981000.1 GDP-mannose 4,6-dehydratase [Lachnospiraceae bacterium]